MRTDCRLLVLAPLLVANVVAVADDALIREVHAEFAADLPAISTTVPGYFSPAERAPGLAVGDFLPADDSLRTWSAVIGTILRDRIAYVPTIRLRMPHPPFTDIDSAVTSDPGAPVLATAAHFRGLHRTLGIETVLTGTLGRDGDALQIQAKLVNSVNGAQRAATSWRATPDTLPSVLIALSGWVYEELDVELSAAEREYLEDVQTLRPESIAAFSENYEDLSVADPVVRRELTAELRKAHPRFAPFVWYEMYARSYPTNLSEVRAQLEGSKRARKDFPRHAGVASLAYAHVPFETLEEHEKTRRLEAQRNLVARNPQDPLMMINLAATYGRHGDHLSALAVALEATERWPDYYRTWWELGNRVSERAWAVRGTGLWREVPKASQERFKLLAFMADRIIDKAISLHAANGSLWQTKINTVGSADGYSGKLMAAFEQGARVAPHHEPIYSNALNFAQNKWGGNAGARRRIITLAEENNPDAAWPRFMRSNHGADFSGLGGLAEAFTDEFKLREIVENPAFWRILFFLIIAGLVLFAYVSNWLSRRTPGAHDYGMPDHRNHKRPPRRELTPAEKLEQVQRRNR